jgi:hypothetical protein
MRARILSEGVMRGKERETFGDVDSAHMSQFKRTQDRLHWEGFVNVIKSFRILKAQASFYQLNIDF